MSVPELPAEIHDLIIDHLFVDSREKGEHNAILKVAQVCKSFARLIIPRLYRNLVVQKNCSTLKALVDKLIRDPKLARTVRTFRTHAYDDYVDDDDFDEEWVEQLGTHTFFNSDESNSKTINLSSGWEVHNCFEDGLIGVILLCCPNLQSMELDELDFIDNHTSGPRVFWSDFFPWQNLDHVRVSTWSHLGRHWRYRLILTTSPALRRRTSTKRMLHGRPVVLCCTRRMAAWKSAKISVHWRNTSSRLEFPTRGLY